MRTVWKFSVPLADKFVKRLPTGSRPLHFGLQGEYAQIWVEVPDTNAPTVDTKFLLVGTGSPMPVGDWRYLGTMVYATTLVLHLFVDRCSECTLTEPGLECPHTEL